MVYDSMSAWGRHAFDFNDTVRSYNTYRTKHHSVPTLPFKRPTGDRHSSMPIATTQNHPINRIEEEEPPSPPPSAPAAPSFKAAKSQWSPPPSPRTRSLRSSPTGSPTSPFQRKDSARALNTPPLSPADQSALASKLYAAATAGDLKHINLLLSLGAPINTPAMIADLYDAFKPPKPGCLSALAGAAGHGQLSAVKLLLSADAALNPTMRQSSSSPLHQACKADDYDIVAYLLRQGADVNAFNCFNTTPLMYAAKHGSPALVRLLLSYSPDVHALSFIKTAAIHWSLWSSPADAAEEKLELLLQAGADPDCVTGDGSTPLHCAARAELPGLARVLVRWGADPRRRTEAGETPGMVATEAGSWETARVLEEAELQRRR